MIITNEKTVKRITKIIYDINQIVKNIYKSDEDYFYLKGKLISASSIQLPQYVICDIKKDKDELVNEFFKNSIFSINGKKLFDFIDKDEDKKYNKINYIEVNGNSDIIFKKNKGNEIRFSFKDKEKFFLKKFRSYNENIKNNFNKLIFSQNLDNKYIDNIIENSNSIFRFIFNLDDQNIIIDNDRNNDKDRNMNYLEITLSKKFILGLKIKKLKKGNKYSETKVNIYKFNDNKSLFLVEFIVNNDLCYIKQYYIIVGMN